MASSLTVQKGDLEIREVHGKKDLRRFITLPRKLYKGIGSYRPSLDMEQEMLLHPRKSPVFRHSDIQYFLALRDGHPVGRIAAILDHQATKYWGPGIGYFGALDALPEKEIVSGLLRAAEGWLRQRGVTLVQGPVTLSPNGESGMLVEGFDSPMMMAIPWHPKGLAESIEASGYTPSADLLSYRLELTGDVARKFRIPGNLKLGEGRLGRLSVSRMNKKKIVSQSEVLRALYNDAWDGKYNFVPLQEYEISALLKQVKPILRPEHYIQIDQDGEPVAMALVLPNMFDVAGDMDGRLTPVNALKLGYRVLTHKFNSARVILLGVSGKVRGSVLGSLLPALMIKELLQRPNPYKWVEFGWVQEKDMAMRNLAESLVPTPHKRHRMFERNLTSDS